MNERPESALIIEQQMLGECEEGLRETVNIFRKLHLPDGQIAFMFRKIAEEIAPMRIIAPNNDTEH